MNLDQFKFSVCVRCVTYNHSPYIKDAMDGFCIQETSFPYVCVIIDDASTDGEQEIINRYLEDNFDLNDNTTFRIVENDAFLMTFARHKKNENCFFAVYLLKFNHHRDPQKKHLKTKYISEWSNNVNYIAFCEGDDYWIDSLKLQKQVNFLEGHPDFTMVHTSIKYYYEFEKKYYSSNDIRINTRIISEGLSLERILTGYQIHTCSVLMRGNALINAIKTDDFLFGGYFLTNDAAMWYSLRKLGRICFLPEITSVYRKNRGSITMQNDAAKRLRFSLSAAELRLYLAQRDQLSKAFIRRSQEKYNRALFLYMLYDRNFKPIFDYQEPSSKFLIVMKRLHLLKGCMSLLIGNRTWIGYIRRLVKNSL